MEKEYIIDALKKTNWHRENAARLLGITRKMLGDRINKYELKKSLMNNHNEQFIYILFTLNTHFS